MAVALWLTPLAACLSNPTPHPESHDGMRHEWDSGSSPSDDQDPDKGGGGDAITEVPSGNYNDGVDVVGGDVDPTASIGDAVAGDGVNPDDGTDDDDGEGEGDDAEDDSGGEGVPATPDDDFSSSCGGGNPPITDP